MNIIVYKVRIVREWYDEVTGGECRPTLEEVFELITKLDLVRAEK